MGPVHPPLERIVRRLSAAAGGAGMVCLLPLMVLTGVDVAGRTLFGRPLPGVFEISEFLLAACVLLGAAHTHQEKGHVAVGLLLSRLPPRLREAVRLLNAAAMLAVTAVLVLEGVRQGFAEEAVSDQLRIPLGPFRLLVAAGGLLLAGVLGLEAWAALRRLLRRR